MWGVVDVTRWIRTAGIAAGAVVSAGVLATAAFAGDGVATPADPTLSAATDEACGSLRPALKGAMKEARAVPAAPALPVCADAGGVKATEFSWQGPGTLTTTQSRPADTVRDRTPDLPRLPFEPKADDLPQLPATPIEPNVAPNPQLPQLPGSPQLPGAGQLPTTPDVPSERDLPALGGVDPAKLPVGRLG
jgi:hypothetical protein